MKRTSKKKKQHLSLGGPKDFRKNIMDCKNQLWIEYPLGCPKDFKINKDEKSVPSPIEKLMTAPMLLEA